MNEPRFLVLYHFFVIFFVSFSRSSYIFHRLSRLSKLRCLVCDRVLIVDKTVVSVDGNRTSRDALPCRCPNHPGLVISILTNYVNYKLKKGLTRRCCAKTRTHGILVLIYNKEVLIYSKKQRH